MSKNAKNSHFKNSYADLNAILEASKTALQENGCILFQPPSVFGETDKELVETIIMDATSGQYVSASLFIDGSDIQKKCACVTYVRRVTLKALLALEEDDDDGESAVGRGSKAPKHQAPKQAQVAQPDQAKPKVGGFGARSV